jgi:hypothetical protein
LRNPAAMLLNRPRPITTGWPAWLPFAIAVAATAPLTVYWWNLIGAGSAAFDWRIFVQAGERFHAGSPDLYEVTDLYSFRHSPIMAMAMPALAWIGVAGIRLLTIGFALALPTWPMRVLALASWPFAMDVQHGALITLIVLAGAWALRGSKVACLAFLILALLSPRPLMVPIAVYLLWHQPWLRLPALVLFIGHAIAVAATGYGDDWVAMLLSVGTDQIQSPFNVSPSRLIGSLWVPAGFALACVLTLWGRPALAALAISPYVLPHYLLLLLLELRPGRERLTDGHRVPPTTVATT